MVDNASSDGSVDRVRSNWPNVRVMPLNTNVGFARANNEGIRQTTSELILLLNSDTVVPAGAIDALVQALGELPGAAIVGPRLVDAQRESRAVVRAHDVAARRAPAEGARHARRPSDGSPSMTSQPRLVDWVSAACLLVRRRRCRGGWTAR